MAVERDWLFGIVAGLVGLAVLLAASAAPGSGADTTALLVFALCVLGIFWLIKLRFDRRDRGVGTVAVPVAAADSLVLVLGLVVVGSVLFHLMSPWWWTPIASNWSYIDHTLVITFWITGVVFAAVILFMAYCVYRFRHREGVRAAYEPESRKLELWLTVATGIGVAAMLAPGLFVWGQFVTVPEDATEVEVVAQQWHWSYRLPGEDGRLGRSDVRLIGAGNPLGISPFDPHGQDDVMVEAADLHLPVGRPVKVLLRSIDVLHDFYVPEFRAKMDMVPGMITYFWFTPTKTGTFEVLCAELCGVGHGFMRGGVVVDTEEDYLAWLQEQSTFAQLSAPRQVGAAEQARP